MISCLSSLDMQALATEGHRFAGGSPSKRPWCCQGSKKDGIGKRGWLSGSRRKS
jgi:hypothetical protein